MAASYTPDEGDLIRLNFTPQSGREQSRRRPALVLSPRRYNSVTGLLVCVPVTSQTKGYPFEVALSDGAASGVALADQVKSLDWRSRQAERMGRATAAELMEVKARMRALLGIA